MADRRLLDLCFAVMPTEKQWPKLLLFACLTYVEIINQEG
jgi:hypothetical protein